MSNALYNLAAMSVASTGTGTITLNAAANINGVTYLTFSSAGVINGQPVYYSILDSSACELGLGTYSSNTLTRGPITTTSGGAAINMTNTATVLISPPTSQFQEVLTGNRTYYVSTGGSDTANTGLSSASPYATIAKAISAGANLELASNALTIQLLDGTYTEAVTLKNIPGFSQVGACVFQGNTTTPSNVVLRVTAADAIYADSLNTTWDIKGLKIETIASSVSAINFNAIHATNNSIVRISNIVLSSVSSGSAHLRSDNGANITFPTGSSGYSVTGSADTHWYASNTGNVIITQQTIVISTNVVMNAQWALSANLCTVNCFGNTFTGSSTVTGTRYNVSLNAVIFTNGAGATYLPGSVAGTSATGGVYF